MAKILLVTGGSRGIGKAIIERFIADDWQVVNISRTPCKITNVTNLCIDLSTDDWHEQQGAQITSIIQHAEQICLVHNASAYHRDTIESLTPAAFQNAVNISLASPLTLNQLVLPEMRPGSSILFVGSTLSEIAVANRASYVICKHAQIGMMRSLCQDLKGRGITTCCVCPGFVNTSMLTEQAEQSVLDQLMKSKVTAGRLIEPLEIAELIHFCALHPVLNGSVLHANLGQINS